MIVLFEVFLGVIFTALSVTTWKKADDDNLGPLLCVIISVALWIGVGACVYNNVTADAKYQEYVQTRESLVYQLENATYVNDGLRFLKNDQKQELIDRIEEYNIEVARGKALQDNLLVGWYFPNFYSKLELIEY